jgi:hypothetical protein
MTSTRLIKDSNRTAVDLERKVKQLELQAHLQNYVGSFSALRSTAIVGFVPGTNAWSSAIPFDLTMWNDPLVPFDESNGTYTAKEAGIYQFSSAAHISSALPADTRLLISLWKNGVMDRELARRWNPIATNDMVISGQAYSQANSGDVFDIRVTQNSGSAHDLGAGIYTIFQGHRISR